MILQTKSGDFSVINSCSVTYL